MNLRKRILTHNDCYIRGRTIRPKGIMVHSTGANNPRLSRYVAPNDGLLGKPALRHWNQSGVGACPHAFIGRLADGSVAAYQTLPWTMRGWHCGKGKRGSGNDTHISFEICEDGLTDASYFAAVYREAVELTAHLCREFQLDPLADGVVICHAEGHRRGIASNHGDVLHWFPKHGKTMDDFRTDVARVMRGEDVTVTQEQFDKMMDSWLARRAEQGVSPWAKPSLERAKARGITDGSRPQSFATRQEVFAMVDAAVK